MTTQRHLEIIRLLEATIRSGSLPPGERLPAERQLAKEYQVSRNTVREAIKALAEKGVLVSRRGAGTYVAPDALGCLVEGAARRHRRLREVFELRKILEPQIAALAAARITQPQVAEIETVLFRQQEAIATGHDQVTLDERFHRLIAEASGNSVLCEVYTTLHGVLAESRVEELQSPERNRASLAHHTAIVAALRERLPERAAELMRSHMEQVERNLEHLSTSIFPAAKK
jgi:GntR family transcriptional regulator, transcriptional repressor for pyruvate dehydrogenase complex